MALLIAPICTPAWTAGSVVTIHQSGVLVIDGNPVFPIGFTMPPPPGRRTPEGGDGFAELAAAGGTFMRTGAQGSGWNDATISREHQWLDAAARNGLHC